MLYSLIAQSLFGDIKPPYAANSYSEDVSGLIIFFTNIIRLVFLVAGLFVLVKIVLAGFAYITAGGEPKKLEQAWANIWQSLVGMLIMVSAFALAALIGQLFFGNAMFILKPTLYGVGFN
jgi:hypothetical protein